MKSSRKTRLLENYRENHLAQMKKKINKELLHVMEEDSRLSILQILSENKKEVKKGEK
ncbi:MAG: hypothetical protein ACHQYP_05195 [Nitrospiria bacterium]